MVGIVRRDGGGRPLLTKTLTIVHVYLYVRKMLQETNDGRYEVLVQGSIVELVRTLTV